MAFEMKSNFNNKGYENKFDRKIFLCYINSLAHSFLFCSSTPMRKFDGIISVFIFY